MKFIFLIFFAKLTISCDLENPEFQFWYSIDFPYNDLENSIKVSSFYKCIDLCLENENCNAFAFSGIYGVCWLKEKAGIFVEKSGYIAGIRCDHVPDIKPKYQHHGTYPGKKMKIFET